MIARRITRAAKHSEDIMTRFYLFAIAVVAVVCSSNARGADEPAVAQQGIAPGVYTGAYVFTSCDAVHYNCTGDVRIEVKTGAGIEELSIKTPENGSRRWLDLPYTKISPDMVRFDFVSTRGLRTIEVHLQAGRPVGGYLINRQNGGMGEITWRQ